VRKGGISRSFEKHRTERLRGTRLRKNQWNVDKEIRPNGGIIFCKIQYERGGRGGKKKDILGGGKALQNKPI